jgi:hypothetical protein
MARTVLLGLLAVVFGAIATFAAPDPQPDIVGVYRCSGVNPDGTQYEGVAEIAKVEGTYRILWTLSDRSSVLGVGIFSGGVFAVSYFGGAPAVAVYKLDGDKLVGEWTMGGKEGSVYTETLTKVADDQRPRAVPQPRQRPERERPQPGGRGIRL